MADGCSSEGLGLMFKIDGLLSKLSFFTVLLLVASVLLLVVMVTFPLLGIYYGVSRALKRNQLERIRYDVIQTH